MIDNNQLNNYADSNDGNYNQFNKINNDINVESRSLSPNQQNFNNQNFTNLSKLPEKKFNVEVNNNTGKLNAHILHNLNNVHTVQNNRSKDFSNPIVDVPIESRNYLEENVAANKPGAVVGYPKVESTQRTYNFENELELPVRNKVDQVVNNPVNPNINAGNTMNNYDTAGIDFNEFNDFKVDSFKEFADKKGDDFFKNQNDFHANWDDF